MTQIAAYPLHCHWIEPDLCSACGGAQPAKRRKKHGSKPAKGKAPQVAFADDVDDEPEEPTA